MFRTRSWIAYIILLLIVGTAFSADPPKPAAQDAKKKAAAAAAELRLLMLNLGPEAVKTTGPPMLHGVWGSITDFSFKPDEPPATVMYLADGTASAYRSTGGGIVGGQGHESVRRAGSALLDCLEASFSNFHAGKPEPLPKSGYVRFYVHAREGLFLSDVISSDELLAGHHPLSACYIGANSVLTQLINLPPVGELKQRPE
jgi:hypothetical protein